jgi:hypothetical protein
MVDATILHLKQVRQVQQHRVLHSGVAFAWLRVKLASGKVGGGFFPLPVYFIISGALSFNN